MQLSKRLQAIAAFVSEGNRLADIGTDHGYIPIYLVSKGLVPKAYAMDINKGPLIRAEEHIKAEGLSEKIEIRQSDGLDKLYRDEADTILIAGMGGALMVDILSRGRDVMENVKELVLSPHSEWEEVRTYLRNEGYVITEEEMLCDVGKYYIIIKAVKSDKKEELPEERVFLKYGRILLENKDMVLKEYLEKEKDTYMKICKQLKGKNTDSAILRINEINDKLRDVNRALEMLG